MSKLPLEISLLLILLTFTLAGHVSYHSSGGRRWSNMKELSLRKGCKESANSSFIQNNPIYIHHINFYRCPRGLRTRDADLKKKIKWLGLQEIAEKKMMMTMTILWKAIPQWRMTVLISTSSTITSVAGAGREKTMRPMIPLLPEDIERTLPPTIRTGQHAASNIIISLYCLQRTYRHMKGRITNDETNEWLTIG